MRNGRLVNLGIGAIFLVLLLVLTFIILQRGVFQDQTPGKSLADGGTSRVSSGSGPSYNPAVFVDAENTTHVIWGQIVADGIWSVMYSNNSTGSYKQPVTLSGKDYRFGRIIGYPNDPDRIAILFEGYRTKYGSGCESGKGGGCMDVYAMESTNGGTTWSQAQQLPHANDFVQRYNIVGTVTPSGDLIALYTQNSGKNLVWSKKPASGSWGSEQVIPGGAAFYQFPAIASDVTGAYAIITGGADGPSSSLYFTKLTGGSWSTPRIIDADDRSYYSSIALDGSSLYIVDADQRGNKVGSLISANQGSSFQNGSLTDDSGKRYFYSQIERGSDGKFYVVWSEGLNAQSRLVLKSGTSLSSLTSLDAPSSAANAPSLSIGPSVVSVAYRVPGEDDIYVFSRSISGANPTVTPTPVPGGEACQGNTNAPAKCFDCLKDSPSDQINILDFACFAKYFGQQLGS